MCSYTCNRSFREAMDSYCCRNHESHEPSTDQMIFLNKLVRSVGGFVDSEPIVLQMNANNWQWVNELYRVWVCRPILLEARNRPGLASESQDLVDRCTLSAKMYSKRVKKRWFTHENDGKKRMAQAITFQPKETLSIHLIMFSERQTQSKSCECSTIHRISIYPSTGIEPQYGWEVSPTWFLVSMASKVDNGLKSVVFDSDHRVNELAIIDHWYLHASGIL